MVNVITEIKHQHREDENECSERYGHEHYFTKKNNYCWPSSKKQLRQVISEVFLPIYSNTYYFFSLKVNISHRKINYCFELISTKNKILPNWSNISKWKIQKSGKFYKLYSLKKKNHLQSQSLMQETELTP